MRIIGQFATLTVPSLFHADEMASSSSGSGDNRDLLQTIERPQGASIPVPRQICRVVWLLGVCRRPSRAGIPLTQYNIVHNGKAILCYSHTKFTQEAETLYYNMVLFPQVPSNGSCLTLRYLQRISNHGFPSRFGLPISIVPP